jgi:predicted amidophosphoribosyltransferase
MRLIKAYLPRATKDGTDLEARSRMLAAASMGATAFQKGLGAVHAIAHPVGSFFDTHHGLTNAVILPYVMVHNREAIADRMQVVSRLLDLRLAARGLRRVRATAPQVGLSRQERAGNLNGAFAADPSLVAGQHVVLIDDVVTTGSTATEAASTLRAAGAESIAIWAVARALGGAGRERECVR